MGATEYSSKEYYRCCVDTLESVLERLKAIGDNAGFCKRLMLAFQNLRLSGNVSYDLHGKLFPDKMPGYSRGLVRPWDHPMNVTQRVVVDYDSRPIWFPK